MNRPNSGPDNVAAAHASGTAETAGGGHHSTGHHLQEHSHDHGHHGPHSHGPHGHGHGHGPGGHVHAAGFKGWLRELFVPHSHDSADSVDAAMESSAEGIRAVKISLVGLGATALFQLAIVLISGSVALLADTVHNFSDALTAVPLWIAFLLGRRAPTKTYTHGFGRAEDLAGLFIVAMIALSAVVAFVESTRRFFDPQPVQNLGWVLAAGIVGFAGNELVAVYRIRVGRKIGSAALVADGIHARTDGFTSLAVVAGVIGIWLGFPLADPIIGLFISAAIAVLLWGTVRDIGRRLMDGVDPNLTDRLNTVLAATAPEGTTSRLRWSGHRLQADITIRAAPQLYLQDLAQASGSIETAVRDALPNIGTVTIAPRFTAE
jgi:cation diffusion facilitator family transporter